MSGNDTSSDYPVNAQTRGLSHNASTGSAQGGANWQTPVSHSNPFAALHDTKPAGLDPADPQFNAAQHAADPFEGMSPSNMTQQHIPRGEQHTQASMYATQGQGQGASDKKDSYANMGQNTQPSHAQTPRETFQASSAQAGQGSTPPQEHYSNKGQVAQELSQDSGQTSHTLQGYDKSGADAAESAQAVMGDYASSGKGEQQPSTGSETDTLSSYATQAKQGAQDTANSAPKYARDSAHSTPEANQGSAGSADNRSAASSQQPSDRAASTRDSVADAAGNAQQTAQDTARAAQDTAGSYYQSAKDTFDDFTQQDRQGAQGTAASAQDAAGNYGQQAKQGAQRAAETGQDYLQSARDTFSANAQKATHAAQGSSAESTDDAAGQQARGKAQEGVEAGQGKSSEYGQSGQADTGGDAHAVQETAGNYAQQAKEALAGTLESAQNSASKYTQQAQGAARDASDSAQQTATKASQQAQESTDGKSVQNEAAGYTERAKQATQEGADSFKSADFTKEADKAANNAAGTADDYADAAKEATVGDAAAAVNEDVDDGDVAEGSRSGEAPGGRQGVVGWAVNTATSTVRGVARTAGSAANTAGGIASRAGQMVGLTKKAEAELPAEKPGVTTSTGLQASRIEDIPGRPQSVQGKVMETAEGAIQKFNPFSRIHQHVCGFHFYAHDITRQVEAHHFCACPNEDVRQCVIYDSDKPNARLIGTEYIISDKLFETLPEEEKVYWHSHKYEVQSGTLQAPRVPVQAEDLEMQKLVNTYGKTFHTWQVDRGDVLPFGPPQLMMAFTGDGATDPRMVAKRDAQYGTNSDERKAHREQALDFSHQPSKAADHWMQGNGAYQLQLNKTDFHSEPGSQNREE